MDVGAAAVTRMAREDTRWFVVAVIVLSLVLFLALPLSVLIVVDHMRFKSQIKAEVRTQGKELRKLKDEVKAAQDAEKGNQ